MEDGYSAAMDRGWFRERRLALVSVVLVIAAVGAQLGEHAAVASIPPPHPENPHPLFPEEEELIAAAWWLIQALLAAVAGGFGIAAVLRRPGRVIGIVTTVVSLGVLVL